MSHPTREALLEAGLKVVEAVGLANMTIDQIVAKAGVAKGTFYNHFSDRRAFLVALHVQFHQHLKQLILNETETIEHGAERLYRGAVAYLDGCLAGRAVKALLLEARTEPAIAQAIQKRNAEFTHLAAADFAAMGWPNPEAGARLFVAMTAEAALAELEAGGQDAAIRSALEHFIRSRSSERLRAEPPAIDSGR